MKTRILLLGALACAPAVPDHVESAGERASSVEPGESVADAIVVEPVLAGYDFDERLWRAELPGRLDEVSGLAFSDDGRLFAHDDERGRVYELDTTTGAVRGRFDLGQPAASDDFEGIAIAGDHFFMISSTGLLYTFGAGDDEEDVDFTIADTGVGSWCEVEGLEFDPGERLLLMACKVTSPDRGYIEVARWSLDEGRLATPIRIDRAALSDFGLESSFDPSGITWASGGTLLLISGRHDAIVEARPDGGVVYAVELRGGRHPQSEGIAMAPDGTLFVSDEARGGDDARLTAYGPRREDAGS